MVDLIGPAANHAASAMTGAKNVDSVQAMREQASSSHTNSTDVVDEVSISNEAMDIGRVMELVQEAKARVQSEPQMTLSNDSERLNMLA